MKKAGRPKNKIPSRSFTQALREDEYILLEAEMKRRYDRKGKHLSAQDMIRLLVSELPPPGPEMKALNRRWREIYGLSWKEGGRISAGDWVLEDRWGNPHYFVFVDPPGTPCPQSFVPLRSLPDWGLIISEPPEELKGLELWVEDTSDFFRP